MNRIERPLMPPYVGAVLLRGDDPEFFIDTGIDLRGLDPRVYVSSADLRALLRVAGWPTPEERDAVVAERDGLAARVAELEADNGRLEAEAGAVAVLKNSRLWKQEAKPGRPKAPTKAAA